MSTEGFTVDDARALIEFAKDKGLGLVSFWAVYRDQPCPHDELAVCSQVNTRNFEFSDVFRGVERASAVSRDAHTWACGHTPAARAPP